MVARVDLVEDFHCVIGCFDDECETFCVDPQRKGEEGTTRCFTLGEPDDLFEFGSRQQSEFETIRRNANDTADCLADRVLPFAEL